MDNTNLKKQQHLYAVNFLEFEDKKLKEELGDELQIVLADYFEILSEDEINEICNIIENSFSDIQVVLRKRGNHYGETSC